ncbi:MAG: hypothetical protein ACLGIN_18445 [Candidatus Sericytochromatia bacterium]
MKLRFACALAATMTMVAPAGAALANVYDARTLGMGGSSVGYAGNASLAYWNPAAVGMGSRFGMYLPSISASFSNNILSPQDAMNMAGTFSNLGQADAGSSSGGTDTVFTNLAGSNGLTLQFQSIVEPLGMSIGKVGPGNMSLRVYGQGIATARATLSQDFAQDMNGLFFEGGFTQITDTITKISQSAGSGTASQQQLTDDVQTLKSQLGKYMGSFMLQNGETATTKSFDLSAVTSANGAIAATYAQVVPLSIPALPEAELSFGVTGKVLSAPQLPVGAPMVLPGGNGSEQLSPVGGGIGANVSLNIDRQVTDLVKAIEAFEQDQNLATSSELASKTGAFLSDGLSKSKIGFMSATPGGIGAGFDLGAAMKFNKEWSAGLALQNPILLWNAKRTLYQYDFSGDAVRLVNVGSVDTAFNEAEPFVARLGGAWQPVFGGPELLGSGWLFNLGLNVPVSSGVVLKSETVRGREVLGTETYRLSPSVNLGMEKLFGPLALRLGTQQGGIAPLYTAGLGLQTSVFQLNLGLGADSPSPAAKSAAFALSLGAGF